MMFGVREHFEYFVCAGCDTLQILDALEGDELLRHYPENYYSYTAADQPRVSRWLVTQHDSFKLRSGGRLFGRLLATPLLDGVVRALLGGDVPAMLARLAIDRDARILDVGCGGGELLDRLRRVGFTQLTGADPYLPADGATPGGTPLLKRELAEVTGEFDVIMFNHSLEHMLDPIAALQLARERLAAGGRCLARVPTTSSEAWEVYGADWVQIDAPRHVFVPSRHGMSVAAEQAGLRVETTLDDSSLGQFLGSEAYRRDVPVTDPKILRLFGPRQLWQWEQRAVDLNRAGRGDQTGFVLRAN
ncbi:class I SAM-dependent methyltransferase [[Mycobacterium] burgundiense]